MFKFLGRSDCYPESEKISLNNPYSIVRQFESTVAEYASTPYAIAIDSCTNALFLCCKYLDVGSVFVPKRTYLSVPMSIIHAGGDVVFEDREWAGIYQLRPYPIWDAAKRLTSDMYMAGQLMCLSFHIKKHLSIGKGGMILTDDPEAAAWFKRARYEGRNEKPYKEDDIEMLGWNMYMTPQQAAHGLALMQDLPRQNADLEEKYRDLTEFSVFKNFKKKESGD